ncbi:F-box domain-containing protein [Forsythia ovata]|uniref:F-box domain-containing protein n=1 Tax=Forsythia ovata TaxID=205694 RepID=A0ABD1XCC8_9LAMI
MEIRNNPQSPIFVYRENNDGHGEVSDKNFRLPKEMLLEILSRLPAKSIFRFKCVCKEWLSLISDPSFLQSEDSIPWTLLFQYDIAIGPWPIRLNYAGMHCFISNEPAFSTPNFLLPSEQIPYPNVVASNDDLLLFRSGDHELVYSVCNPFTRQCITLPPHTRRTKYGATGFISHIRNGVTSYKVVRIISNGNICGCKSAQASTPCEGYSLSVETFSSETGEWRNSKIHPRGCSFSLDFGTRPCIVFNGIVHWIHNEPTSLLAYAPYRDLDQCRFISIPNETFLMNGMNTVVGVSQGNLRYFEVNEISMSAYKLPSWKLWVLKNYEEGEWILEQEGLERKIDSLSTFSSVLKAYSPLLPVAFHPWNKDKVFFRYEGYVLTFNIKTGWFEDGFYSLSCKNMLSTLAIFPLLLPMRPTRISEPHLDAHVAKSIAGSLGSCFCQVLAAP